MRSSNATTDRIVVVVLRTRVFTTPLIRSCWPSDDVPWLRASTKKVRSLQSGDRTCLGRQKAKLVNWQQISPQGCYDRGRFGTPEASFSGWPLPTSRSQALPGNALSSRLRLSYPCSPQNSNANRHTRRATPAYLHNLGRLSNADVPPRPRSRGVMDCCGYTQSFATSPLRSRSLADDCPPAILDESGRLCASAYNTPVLGGRVSAPFSCKRLVIDVAVKDLNSPTRFPSCGPAPIQCK